MKVFIVTRGSYSDYGIEKVYLDVNKAREFIRHQAKLNKYRQDLIPETEDWMDFADYQIEEYETSDDEILPNLTKYYRSSCEFELSYLKRTLPYVKGSGKELANWPPDENNIKVVLREEFTYKFNLIKEEGYFYTDNFSEQKNSSFKKDHLLKSIDHLKETKGMNISIGQFYTSPVTNYILGVSTRSQEVATKIVQDQIPQIIQILEENEFIPYES